MKFVTEESLSKVLEELIITLTNNEDIKISKNSLLKRLTVSENTVNKLDIKLWKTFEYPYQRKIYIPLTQDVHKESSYDIRFMCTTINAGFSYIDLTIPAKFATLNTPKPIINSITLDTRKHFKTITASIVSVTRLNSEVNTYICLDFGLDSLTGSADTNVLTEVRNLSGNTDIVRDLQLSASETLTTGRAVTVDCFPICGFDDIPNRDKIVRSSTYSEMETITEEDYQALETANKINPKVLYFIPEKNVVVPPPEEV